MSVCEKNVCSVSPAPAAAATPDEPARAGAGGYRAVLGRATWLLLHEMSNNLPCASDLPLFYATVAGVVRLYPCATCRENAVRILESDAFSGTQPLPREDEEARRVARAYVNRLHAAVTESVASRGGYVSARSAELARVYLRR